MLFHYDVVLSNITCPSYTIFRAGLGINIYYRRIDAESQIEMFIMHPDNWGQYVVDDRPALYEFIEGCEYIDDCDSDIMDRKEYVDDYNGEV